VHQAWNARFWRSASSRVSAYGNLREQTPRLSLALERQLVEDVQEAMVPASLLLHVGEHRGQRAPDPEMAIADHQLRRRQLAPLEVAQDRRPALRRFPIATLDGEDHFLPVAQRRQDDEDRRLVFQRFPGRA
jgi:hypothetical protein